MATVTTSKFVKATDSAEPFAMMEYKGIFARLVEEVSLAAKNFSQDPRAFIKELFLDESNDLRRKKLIRMGLSLALIFHVAAGIFLVTFKWRGSPLSKETSSESQLIVKQWITPDKPKVEESPEPDSSSRSNFSKTPQEGLSNGDKSAASSGGGQNDPTPANKGVPPQLAPIPSIIPPTAQNVPNPSLPVNPSLKGDNETPPPPPSETIGSPTGTGTTPSGGTGINSGVGEGKNGGVGNNNGPGSSSKNGDKPGGNETGGTPDASIVPTGIPYVKLSQMPESTGIVWISRVRPIVTPEAQADKVYGYVLLEATFNANGTITNIVVRTHLQGMDDAAIEALRRAKFRPATIKGQPVTLYKVPIKVPVNLGSSS
jgi:TonB family protein